MQTAPVTLEGSRVLLEPLSLDHFSALAEIAFAPEIWKWMNDSMQTEADLQHYIQYTERIDRFGSRNGDPLGDTFKS